MKYQRNATYDEDLDALKQQLKKFSLMLANAQSRANEAEEEAAKWKDKAYDELRIASIERNKQIEDSPAYNRLLASYNKLKLENASLVEKISTLQTTPPKAVPQEGKEDEVEELKIRVSTLETHNNYLENRLKGYMKKLEKYEMKMGGNSPTMEGRKKDKEDVRYLVDEEVEEEEEEVEHVVSPSVEVEVEDSAASRTRQIVEDALQYPENQFMVEVIESKVAVFRSDDKLEAFLQRFQITQKDKPKTYFMCTYKGILGNLYITSHYVIFEASAGRRDLRIRYEDIISMDKVKSMNWLPGKGSSLELRLSRREDPIQTLSSLRSRKKVAKLILFFAKLCGHNIACLRLGEIDRDWLVPSTPT